MGTQSGFVSKCSAAALDGGSDLECLDRSSTQVGPLLGTTLLSTLAASATTSYVHGKASTPSVISRATVHG